MIRQIPGLAIAAVIFNSCTHADVTLPEAQGKLIAYKNIVYGADSLEQAADVYLPATGDKRPVIILLHGGAWVNPGKFAFDGLGLDTFFTSDGFVVINMDYRLRPKYAFPAPVDDIGLVMELVKKKSAEWKLNADNVCLLGRSAGAHLALLYAYSRNKDGRIKAVIDYSGPTDFTDSSVTYGPLGINATVLLGDYANNKDLWNDASPISHVDGAVPTVIFQGTNDSLVFPVQARLLQSALGANGVPCLYINGPGDGHGWQQQRWVESRKAVLHWVKFFLQPQ